LVIVLCINIKLLGNNLVFSPLTLLRGISDGGGASSEDLTKRPFISAPLMRARDQSVEKEVIKEAEGN